MTKPISLEAQSEIEKLYKRGHSIREIAQKIGVSKSTVWKYQNTSTEDVEKKTKTRPKLIKDGDWRIVTRALKTGDLETANDIKSILRNQLEINVSTRTIRRKLQDSGFRAKEKVKKPKFSQKNIKERYSFAKRYKDWTIEDWKRVIWSDETKINRFQSDGKAWCWKHKDESLKPHHVKQTVKHGGGNIMIWGCMTWNGVGFMCKINETMNQKIYAEILQGELLDTINHFKLNPKEIYFQHDNDPKHTARSVKDWLLSQDFETIEWPSQSPDLNPIEHLWVEVKRKLRQLPEPPKGICDLWEHVQDIWNEIRPETCQNLIESMPNRIKAVLKAKGRWTRY